MQTRVRETTFVEPTTYLFGVRLYKDDGGDCSDHRRNHQARDRGAPRLLPIAGPH